MSKYVIIDGKHISFLKKYFEPEIKKTELYEFKFYAFDELPLCDYSEITNYIIDNQIDIKNGDIIVFCDPNELYRNAGKCIWYNRYAIPLSHKCDEYGEVPECFEIAPMQYNPRYWINTIAHNIHYWPCLEYRQQCCCNITTHTISNSNEYIRYTWFLHNDIKEYVVLEEHIIISDKEFKNILNIEPYDGISYVDYFLEDMNKTNTSSVSVHH